MTSSIPSSLGLVLVDLISLDGRSEYPAVWVPAALARPGRRLRIPLPEIGEADWLVSKVRKEGL